MAIIPLQVNTTTHNLSIMLVVSFGQSGFNSSGVIPAADIALKDINKNPDMLPGYILTYDRVRDSQVSADNILIQISNKMAMYTLDFTLHLLPSTL